MSRKENIIASFEDNFSKYKNANIVIYGVGEYAQWIISNYKDEYNILGFLDRWAYTGKIYEKPILSYEQLIEKNINVIIIAASAHSTPIIFNRIEKFCVDNEIKVFSLEGKRLDESDSSYFDISKKSSLGRFHDCKSSIRTKRDALYWQQVEERFFADRSIFDNKGRIHLKNAYDIGYLFLGPIVSDFILWLIGQAKENCCDGIFFSARDGYIFYKIYQYLQEGNIIEDLPQAYYVLTSRYVCMLSGLYYENDIVDCSKVNFMGNCELMLQKRFLLDEEEIFPYKREQYDSEYQYLLIHKKAILEKATFIRNNYMAYLQQYADMEQKFLFFDLAASGTCQNTIQKLTGKDMIGAYMLRMPTEDSEKKNMKIYAYKEYDEKFADRSMFMESILTSTMPTLLYINESKQPVYATETRSHRELEFVNEAQKGIWDFFVQFIKKADVRDWNLQKSETALCIYNHIASYSTIIENEVFRDYVIKDEIFNEKNSILNKCMI